MVSGNFTKNDSKNRKSNYSQVSFISSREGFPPLPQLPYQLNAPRPHSSHFFGVLLRASRGSETVGRGGERET